jgi:hypothetical protein
LSRSPCRGPSSDDEGEQEGSSAAAPRRGSRSACMAAEWPAKKWRRWPWQLCTGHASVHEYICSPWTNAWGNISARDISGTRWIGWMDSIERVRQRDLECVLFGQGELDMCAHPLSPSFWTKNVHDTPPERDIEISYESLSIIESFRWKLLGE